MSNFRSSFPGPCRYHLLFLRFPEPIRPSLLDNSEGLKLPVAKATFDQYRRLVDVGKGGLDKSGVAELVFKGRMTG